jgi:O-antigen ligase/polysaccharide polymerase Wzy-like membrane protein
VTAFVQIGCAVLVALAPVLRDGPLDVDLWSWKLALAASLLCLSQLVGPGSNGNRARRRTAVLVVVNLVLVITAYRLSPTPWLCRDIVRAYCVASIAVLLFQNAFSPALLAATLTGLAGITLVASALTIVQYVVVAFHLTFMGVERLLPPDMQRTFFELGHEMSAVGIRVPSFFFHSNQAGHFFAISCGFFLPLAATAVRGPARGGAAIVSAAAIFGILMTQSRTALVMLVAELCLVGWFATRAANRRPRSADQRRRLRTSTIVGTTVGGVATAALCFLAHTNLEALAGRLWALDLSHRSVNWRYAVALLPASMWFGVGPGASGYQIVSRFPLPDMTDYANARAAGLPLPVWGSHPHNYALGTILETGVFSLLVQLVLYGGLIATGVRLVRSGENVTIRRRALIGTTPLAAEALRTAAESHAFLGAPEVGVSMALAMALLTYLPGSAPAASQPAREAPGCARPR